MIVPGATAENAQRYVLAALCGGALALGSLGAGKAAGDVDAMWIAGVCVGMVLCILAAAALIAGVYRRSKALRAAGRTDSVAAAFKRQQWLNAGGALFMFASAFLQSTHAFFGAPQFAGQWALEIGGMFAGLVLQLQSHALCLRTLE